MLFNDINDEVLQKLKETSPLLYNCNIILNVVNPTISSPAPALSLRVLLCLKYISCVVIRLKNIK